LGRIFRPLASPCLGEGAEGAKNAGTYGSTHGESGRANIQWSIIDVQELVGAKQNRILNTDVLVPAKSTRDVPVSCVERGRWGYKSRHFTPGGSPMRMA